MIRRFNPLYALLPVTLFLGACTTDSDESVTPVTDPDGGATGFVATFKPDVALMPFPTDVWRNGSTDGTLNIEEFDSNPLLSHVEQLNLLDGFGLNSPIWADFSDPVDEETLVLGETVFVFRVAVGGTLLAVPTPVTTFDVGTAGFQGGRSVLELDPTVPLDPLTTYAVIVTAGVQSSDGVNASADAAFQAMLDAFPAEDTDSDSDTVEAIYDGMVGDLLGLAELAGIGADNVVSAWTFTTQSIGQSLNVVQATAMPQANAFVPLGMTTADLNPALAGIADVYVGAIEMPYYLDPANPLTSHWEPESTACQAAVDASEEDDLSSQPASTTAYCPTPAAKSTISVPVLLTIPNDTAVGAFGCTKYEPVGIVIFEHGITQDRTNALAVADTFAQTCRAVIAMDLPLHGIVDATSGLYAIAGNAAYDALEGLVPGITENLTEQTFNLDIDEDDVIDPSGEYFINLESPITARDSLRQAAANLIHLAATIPAIDFDLALAAGGDPDADVGADFAAGPIDFVGHSLGGITGTTFLGVDTTVNAAVLAFPGGDIGDLILESESIYPEVEAGLTENGLTAGMRFFDEFFRNAQTLIEGGDPINYAVAANANHPILMMTVVGGAGVNPDAVVPNSATQALADAMGLPVVSSDLGPVAEADGLVRFSAGDHSSILDPTTSGAATVEMQTQMATFVGSGGALIDITDTSVIAQ